jgi:hypothetical protein
VFASPVVSMAGNATTDLQNLPISLVEVCEHESHSVDLHENTPLWSSSATDLRLHVKYRTGGTIKEW